VEDSCEHGNEPSGSIKWWEVLEWLHNWRLLKKGSAPYVSKVSTVTLGLRKKVSSHIFSPLRLYGAELCIIGATSRTRRQQFILYAMSLHMDAFLC
jgi:hypothetical protein